MKRAGAWLGLLLAVAISPTRAVGDALTDGMRHCATESEARRLACFDALAATLPQIEDDRFGLTADIANKRDPESERRVKEAVLLGKIVALGQGPRGEYIFTLDNQQVWMQTETEPNKKFAVGELVHIEHGALGSLWLAAGGGRMTRVKRVS